MDLFTAMDISASGLRAQRTRMNIISSNIANAQTTRTSEGGPYKRRDVILKENSFEGQLASVDVESIVTDPTPGKQIYDPGNPDADEKGYLTMPNVNMMEEMVNMIVAQRAYEVNSKAIQTSDNMLGTAIGLKR